MQPPLLIDVRPPVAEAIQAKKPVVAMLSAPLTHTFPWPTNVETVKLAKAAAQEEGATLAVIGVLKGRLTVGMEIGEVETLVRSSNALRASRRDLAAAVIGGRDAGTTVSASMYLAWRAGIRVLATGAVGGAGQPDARTRGNVWNISADLLELSQTPVAVISAGARSVYSLAYTAEVLETFRVPVVAFGTDFFPIFYMRAGDHPASARTNTPAETAALLEVHWGLDGAGVIIAKPTPVEVALSPDELIPALRGVEQQADEDRVPRKELSPFLMEKLNRLTKGKVLRAYQAILVSNTRLAAQIARELIGTGRSG